MRHTDKQYLLEKTLVTFDHFIYGSVSNDRKAAGLSWRIKEGNLKQGPFKLGR